MATRPRRMSHSTHSGQPGAEYGAAPRSSQQRIQGNGERGPISGNYEAIPATHSTAPEAQTTSGWYRNGTAPQVHPGAARSQDPTARVAHQEDRRASLPTDQTDYHRRPGPQRSATQPLPSHAANPVPAQYVNRSQESWKASDTEIRSGSQPSPLSRTSTVRSSTGERPTVAWEKSPLQQFEANYNVNGRTKEEKRARVMEAERRLKEQIARRASQASQGSGRPDMDRRPSNKEPVSQSGQTSASMGRDQAEQDSFDQASIRIARQQSVSRHPPPTVVQYTKVQAPREPQYATSRNDHDALGRTPDSDRSRDEYRSRSHSIKGPRDQVSGMQNVPHQEHPRDPGTAIPPRPLPTRPDSIKAQNNTSFEYGLRSDPTRSAQQQTPGVQLSQYPESARPPQGLGSESAQVAQMPANTGARNPQQDTGSNETPPPQTKKRPTVSFDVPPPTPPPLDEYKQARVARLRVADRNYEQQIDVDRGKAWWEQDSTSKRRRSRALPADFRKPPLQVNEKNGFQPPLFLKCGPLLQYRGIRRTTIDGPHGPVEQEFWRGSVMIVTTDSRSNLEKPPVLRLFGQPMDLLPPPPRHVSAEDGARLPPEYIDPTAGLVKVGRDGRPLYVKPVEHVDEEVDLSHVENEDGLFEYTPSPIDYSPDGPGKPVPSNRLHPLDGEKAGLYEEVPGFRLYSDPARDVTFWRFNIEVELGEKQERIAYRINNGPAIGFWIPGKGQPMSVMFYSCNGFSLSVDSNKFSGPDPLWRDVLNEHQTRPFHVMIGGGDQVYNDKLIEESKLFQEWTRIKNPHTKAHAPFNAAMKAEMETFYLNRYASWFSQGLFGLANSQIPMVNMWDDHDIIDGYGSYPDHFMRTPVFTGLGNVAFKYYLLFQHQSVPEETEQDEPSWLLGAEPGPYINARSHSLFMSLGKPVALLALDCRTERMRDEILSDQTYDLIWERCHREIVKGVTKHLIVVVGVPVAYPRLVWLENILTSRVMDPVKALGRAGLFGGFLNKFDGGVEILDDLDDHWTSKHHKLERTWFIEDLQDLAAEKSVRVTILSGDVHLAAIGQFYSNPKLKIAKHNDYRYMPNIISSAIANSPPPELLADVLNKRNKVHHMDTVTDEDMIPIFTHDVDAKPRNNKRLLPRRNWCSIREYQPGTTPPPTPPEPESPPTPPDVQPGRIKRTLSLGRGDGPRIKRTLSLGRGEGGDGARGGLLRRLSQRGPPPTRDFNLDRAPVRRFSMDGPRPPTRPSETGDSYFPERPGPFLRRPTNLSQKASKKNKDNEEEGRNALVNLEGGLDVTLNLEVNPKDPAGITTPYRLLVPALWHEGGIEPEPERVVKGWRKWFGRGKKNKKQLSNKVDDDLPPDDDEEEDVPPQGYPPQQPRGQDDYDDEEEEEEESAPPTQKRRWFGLR